MTIDELRINLDVGNPIDVLKANAKECAKGWLFVDSSDGLCYLFSKNGKEKDISKLTAIDNELFYNDQTLTKIALPPSIKHIGQYAFEDCVNLANVMMSDSVASIAAYAFANCNSLTSITIPNNVASIGRAVFCYCSSLAKITIPDSVIRIGVNAFYKCNKLTSVIFQNKTIDEVMKMHNYPWGIRKSVLKCKKCIS